MEVPTAIAFAYSTVMAAIINSEKEEAKEKQDEMVVAKDSSSSHEVHTTPISHDN